MHDLQGFKNSWRDNSILSVKGPMELRKRTHAPLYSLLNYRTFGTWALCIPRGIVLHPAYHNKTALPLGKLLL